MGLLKPKWVDKSWWAQCPFNYCDHFGDREKLATVCKICKDELLREKLYKKAGKDPHNISDAMKDIANTLGRTMMMVQKKAEEMGIDLNNLDDVEESPPPENYPIYHFVVDYGDTISKFLKKFTEVPIDADLDIITRATDAFGHSRFYIIAKIVRALSSRFEEQKDPDDDLDDSKTSALLAYVAIERNSRAFLALAEHKPLVKQRRKFLNLAKKSLQICNLMQEEFFSGKELEYEEFGCDYFKNNEIKKSIS